MVRKRSYQAIVRRVRKLVCSTTGLLLWGGRVLGADLGPAELQKAAIVAADGVEQTAFQTQPPATIPPTAPAPPAVPGASTGPTTTLEPVEVVAEPPAPIDLTPQLPAPTNAFADTIYDSPFFDAPVRGYAAGNNTTGASTTRGAPPKLPASFFCALVATILPPDRCATYNIFGLRCYG